MIIIIHLVDSVINKKLNTTIMLLFIIDPQHPVMDYIKDDPVRPEIPKEFRVGPNRFISALVDEKPSAIVCVNLLNCVPKTVNELGDSENPTTAVFYTIWSYVPGAGTRLLRETVRSIREKYPTITRFVTLSPKTDMARKFHIRNGAIVLSENDETVNYEYL